MPKNFPTQTDTNRIDEGWTATKTQKMKAEKKFNTNRTAISDERWMISRRSVNRMVLDENLGRCYDCLISRHPAQ